MVAVLHSSSANGLDATVGTGGGGGGAAGNGPMGGNGASGIVVVRYEVSTSAGTAKATGGAISFYNGNTIHAFTNGGTFTVTSPIPGGVTYHGRWRRWWRWTWWWWCWWRWRRWIFNRHRSPVPVTWNPIVIGAGGAGGQMYYGNDGLTNMD